MSTKCPYCKSNGFDPEATRVIIKCIYCSEEYAVDQRDPGFSYGPTRFHCEKCKHYETINTNEADYLNKCQECGKISRYVASSGEQVVVSGNE